MNVHVRANFVFHLFNVSLSFRAQSAKEKCLRFAIFNFSGTLQNIFEIGLKEYGVFVQKSLSLKKYFERKKSQICFGCLCVNLPTVTFYLHFTFAFCYFYCPDVNTQLLPSSHCFRNCIQAELLFMNSNLKMTVEQSKRRSYFKL